MRDAKIVGERTLDFLKYWRFTGDIYGYAEGECYFPYSPLLTVVGTFAECVVLETLVLSMLNYDSAVATAASRVTIAAHDRPCLEMGARRTHEYSAVAAARAAVIGGFVGTSDLEAAGGTEFRRLARQRTRLLCFMIPKMRRLRLRSALLVRTLHCLWTPTTFTTA